MKVGTAAHIASTMLRRSAAEAVFIRSGVNVTRPSDIRATLTERCNYRCTYCDHWRQPTYADEMSLAQWQSALLSVQQFVPRFTVQFLGGEPMMVPWFLDLAAFCADAGINWGVITNGSSLSAERVQRLVAARPLNVDISLDSRRPDLHDAARGVRGSMRRVSEGISRLVDERQKSGARFAIRIKTTITRHTIGALGEIVDWAETMPAVLVDFSPVRSWRQPDREALYPSRLDEMRLLRQAIDALVRRRRNGAPIETSIAKLRAVPLHFAGESNAHGVSECRVGLRSVDIRPNGDVNHCWKYRRIGNLLERSMADIWTDAARREVVAQSVGCELFKTTCSTSCHAHRTLLQEAGRGIRFLAAAPRSSGSAAQTPDCSGATLASR